MSRARCELIANVRRGYRAEVCLAESGQAALTKKLFEQRGPHVLDGGTWACQGWDGSR